MARWSRSAVPDPGPWTKAALADPDSVTHVLAKFPWIGLWPERKPWPDHFAEGTIPYAPQSEALRKMLAWQAAIRIRSGRPLPEGLQAWFNAFVLDGGGVPRRPPYVAVRDSLRLSFFQSIGANQALALRLIAEHDGRRKRTVEQHLRRAGPYKPPEM